MKNQVVKFLATLFSGSGNNGANCSFAIVNANNTAANTNANISFHLSFIFKILDLATWQKIKFNKLRFSS